MTIQELLTKHNLDVTAAFIDPAHDSKFSFSELDSAMLEMKNALIIPEVIDPDPIVADPILTETKE